MILTREMYCDTSPSWPEPLKASKQNRRNESPSKLRPAPRTPETQLVVRAPQDAYPGIPRPDTKQGRLHSDCAIWMLCQSGNWISPPCPKTIARLQGQS